MYTLGIRFFVGRCHAAALLPEVVALIERAGCAPGAVTTRVVEWNDAADAWLEPAIKLVDFRYDGYTFAPCALRPAAKIPGREVSLPARNSCESRSCRTTSSREFATGRSTCSEQLVDEREVSPARAAGLRRAKQAVFVR